MRSRLRTIDAVTAGRSGLERWRLTVPPDGQRSGSKSNRMDRRSREQAPDDGYQYGPRLIERAEPIGAMARMAIVTIRAVTAAMPIAAARRNRLT